MNREGGYQIEGLEELIETGRFAPDLEDARAAFEEVNDIVDEAAVMIPIVYVDNVSLIGPEVRNFQPLGTNFFPLTEVWLEQ